MNYKLLGKSGLKVSELCLGTMGFGKEWGWGNDFDSSKKIFEAFANAGGNFIDTANRYTDGTSEKYIGDFIKEDRDHFVIATKYALKDADTNNVNGSGTNRKNMMRSIEGSLKRMNTDYIDLFYLHIWDNLSPIDEVMRAMEDLIRQGKVNYIGISDTPAWIVSRGNTYAEMLGWNQFVALQVEYSLLQRTPERDLLPMAKSYGMTVVPWAPLAGGALTGKYLKGNPGRIKEGSTRLNDRAVGITKEVMAIANEIGCEPSSVALQWMMNHRDFKCIPIVGATSEAQVQKNVQCLDVRLNSSQMERLNKVSEIVLGFPNDFLNEDAVRASLFGKYYDTVEKRIL